MVPWPIWMCTGQLMRKTSFYSSYVGAEQARVMLQLAINAKYSMDELRTLFEGPLREAIYTSANVEIYGLS